LIRPSSGRIRLRYPVAIPLNSAQRPRLVLAARNNARAASILVAAFHLMKETSPIASSPHEAIEER